MSDSEAGGFSSDEDDNYSWSGASSLTPISESMYGGGHGDVENMTPSRYMPQHGFGGQVVQPNTLSFAGELERLQIQLRKKDLLYDNLRKEHDLKMGRMESDMEDLIHQKKMAEMKLETELKRFDQRVKTIQENTRSELERIQKKQIEIQAQNPILKERFEDIKQQLGDMTIMESHYVELKAIPESQRTLQQYVLVQVYEKVTGVKEERDQLRQQLGSAKEDLASMSMDVTQLRREKEAIAKSSEGTEKDLKLALNVAESKVDRLTQELQKNMLQVEEMRAKVQVFDQQNRDLKDLEKEAGKLRSDNHMLKSQFDLISGESETRMQQLTEASQSLELLQRDKRYLTKEVDMLNERAHNAEEERVKLQKTLEEVKQSREDIYEKFLSLHTGNKEEFQSRLASEIAKIQKNTEKDIERIRKDSRELANREAMSLREARDEAVQEKQKAQSELEDMRATYEDLRDTSRQTQMEMRGTIAELENQIRIKGFEYDRLQLSYEDAGKDAQGARLETEMYKQKLELVTAEYYAQQTESAKRIAELEASVSGHSQRLRTYEALERDLDEALEVAGQNEESVNLVQSLGASVPTSANRRMQQTVKLSKRIVLLEKENMHASNALSKAEQRNEELANQLQQSNQKLAKTQQPYSYLVESIQLRDQEIDDQKKAIEVLENDLVQLDASNQKLERENQEMRLDLERLFMQREKLETLHAHIMDVHAGNKKKNSMKKSGSRKSKSKKSDAKSGSGSGSGSDEEKLRTSSHKRREHHHKEQSESGQPAPVWIANLKQ